METTGKVEAEVEELLDLLDDLIENEEKGG